MASLRRLAALASAVLLAAGCGGGGGPTASDEAVSQRVVDYFQTTVTTPGLSRKVTKVEDAEMPASRKRSIEVSLAQQSQHVGFYASRTGKYLIRGDAIALPLHPV